MTKRVKNRKKIGAKAANSSASAAIAPAPALTASLSAFTAAAMVQVTFSCSNPNCIVGITAAHIDIAFRGSESVDLPVGTYSLFYRVQGTGQFAVTVAGAQLSAPIAGTAPDGGVRVIQVP